MRVQNHSRLPDGEVVRVVDSVAGFFACATMARLVVEDADSKRVLGATWKFSPNASRYDFIAPSLVRLFVPRAPFPDYPRHDRLAVRHDGQVVQIGEYVLLESLREEIALVLAHELRHVDQFWAGIDIPDHIACERDAEKRAREVISSLRRSPAWTLCSPSPITRTARGPVRTNGPRAKHCSTTSRS